MCARAQSESLHTPDDARHIAMGGNILESIRTFTRYLRFPRPSHCWHRGLLLSEVPKSQYQGMHT